MKKPRADIDGTPVWCVHDAIVDCDKLIPNPKNPNTHQKKQIELLGKIIKHQGWRVPITVSNRSGFIVRGHGRLEAALMTGINAVPIDYQDYENEAMEWADLIADNRLSELSETDEDKLDTLMAEISELDIDLELTGYDDINIDRKSNTETGESVLGDVEYQLIIDCDSEKHQTKLLDRFEKEGLKCRPLML